MKALDVNAQYLENARTTAIQSAHCNACTYVCTCLCCTNNKYTGNYKCTLEKWPSAMHCQPMLPAVSVVLGINSFTANDGCVSTSFTASSMHTPSTSPHHYHWHRLTVCACGISCLPCTVLEEKLQQCAHN